MKLFTLTIVMFAVMLSVSCNSKTESNDQQVQDEKVSEAEITFNEKEAEHSVEVLVDGKLFTAYQWPDNVYKPILYPVFTAAGTEITRGFPLKPRQGERSDHRHQVGIWLNYGNVNGLDFWGNGSSGERNPKGGQVKHLSVEELSEGTGEASMVTTASWIDPSGKELLAEKTKYHFIAKGQTQIIDRITTLTATGGEVSMNDTKEGMFGIRVARQLELPSKGEVTLTDAQGNPTKIKQLTNEGVTGNYRSSEGITGEGVWGTRAKWMNLDGSMGGEDISLVISDHPSNQSYPTYWHARGYGLFASNPFGVKDFTNDKEELNFKIPAGESITLRYRVIVNSGSHLTDAEINSLAEEFGKKYL